MDMEVLWGCICLLKVKLPKSSIMILAIVGIILSILISSEIFGEIFRCSFPVLAALSILKYGRNKE